MTRRIRRSAAWRVGSRLLPALALVAAVAACEAASGTETPRDRTAAAAQPTATATVAAPAPSPTLAAPEPAPTATAQAPDVPAGTDPRPAAYSYVYVRTWETTPCRPADTDYWMWWRNFLQWGPDGREIFLTFGSRLYALAADGSGARTVARGATPEGYGTQIPFDVSPDGQQVVFAGCDYPRPGYRDRGAPDEYTKYKYELSGLGPQVGEAERLTHDYAYNGLPAWSPDGTRVAFLQGLIPVLQDALYVGARRLRVMAAADGGARAARTLVKVKAAADAEDRGLALLAPAWSPDGTRLAFAAADADGTLGIYVVATDGTRPVWLHDLRPLVTDAVSGPAWSPDGTRLAYAKTVDDVLGLYAVAADGTDERGIIGIDFWQRLWRHGRPRPRHVGLVRDVAWSPDGTRLLYVYGAATCVVAENGALLGRALLSPEFPESPEYGRWDCVLTSTGESEHPWPAWVRDRPPGWYHEHGVYKDAESVAAWSPDGERIAFTRTIGMFEDDDVDYPDGMGISLFIMAPDGSGTWQVAFINALGPALRRPPTGDDGSAG